MKQIIYPAIIFFIIFSSFAEGDNALVTNLSYYNITDDDFIKSFEIPIKDNTLLLSNKKSFSLLIEFLEKYRLEAARVDEKQIVLYGLPEDEGELVFTENDLINILYSSLRSKAPFPAQSLEPVYKNNEFDIADKLADSVNQLEKFQFSLFQDMVQSDKLEFKGDLVDTNVGNTYFELDKLLKTSGYVDLLDYYFTKTFYETWVSSNFNSPLLYEILLSKENGIIFNFNLKGMASLESSAKSTYISFTNEGLNLELFYKGSNKTPRINTVANRALELFRENTEIIDNIYSSHLMLQAEKYTNLFILLQLIEKKGVINYSLPHNCPEQIKDKDTPEEINIRDRVLDDWPLLSLNKKCQKIVTENELEIKAELVKPIFHFLFDIAVKYYGLSSYTISKLDDDKMLQYMLTDDYDSYSHYESKEEILSSWLDEDFFKLFNYFLANGDYIADSQLDFNLFWNDFLKDRIKYKADSLFGGSLNFNLMESLKSGGITLDVTPIMASNSLFPTMLEAIKEDEQLTGYPLILKELKSVGLLEKNEEQLEEIRNLFLPPINTGILSFDEIVEKEWIQLTTLGLNRNRSLQHLFEEIDDVYIVTDLPDLKDIVKNSAELKPVELMAAENLHSLLLSLDKKKWVNLAKESSPQQVIAALSKKAGQEKKHIFLLCHQFGKKLHFTNNETLDVKELGDNITPIACNTYINSEHLNLITTDEINLVDALTAIEIIYQMGGDKKTYVLYDYYNALIKRNKKFRGICTRYIESLKSLN